MRRRNRAEELVGLRAAHRARLVERATRPWAQGHYDRAIQQLDAGETLVGVADWDLRILSVSLPHGPHCYDLHPDGSLTPSVIDRPGQ